MRYSVKYRILYFIGEYNIVRDCESSFMRFTRYRFLMLNLRRYGYCLLVRKNDVYKFMDIEDEKVMYCFCNDWNGCNFVFKIFFKVTIILIVSVIILYFVLRFI